MNTEPSLYVEWIKLLPVVVGGMLTLAGGIVGQFITQFLTTRREQKKFLATKLEDLVKAVFAHSQWISEKHQRMLFNDEKHETPSPLDEAVMLQSLYFPELHEDILAAMQASQPLTEFIWKQYIDKQTDFASWLKNYDSTPYDLAYAKHLAILHATVSKCRNLAKLQLS